MKTKINKRVRTVAFLLLSLLLLSLLPFSISAETVYSEGYFKYTISGDEAAIIEYFGSESEIVIPSSLGGRTVTELRGRIFRSDLPVTKLTLPDTLTEIDDSLLTGLSQLRVVVLQSRSISPRVPSGCVIIEDYPVYVDPDSEKYIPSDTTAPNNAVTSDPGTPRTDGSAGGSDIGGPGGSGVSSSGNSGSGAGDQIDGNSDGTFAEKGISAANGCTITVDNTGNLIMIDRSGNITAIDRGRKYGLAEGEDGIIIADENGDCVRLEDDGLTVVYPACPMRRRQPPTLLLTTMLGRCPGKRKDTGCLLPYARHRLPLLSQYAPFSLFAEERAYPRADRRSADVLFRQMPQTRAAKQINRRLVVKSAFCAA